MGGKKRSKRLEFIRRTIQGKCAMKQKFDRKMMGTCPRCQNTVVHVKMSTLWMVICRSCGKAVLAKRLRTVDDGPQDYIALLSDSPPKYIREVTFDELSDEEANEVKRCVRDIFD